MITKPPRTIAYRNEAKRHLLVIARRYGWAGKTYASAKAFARHHPALVFRRILGAILSVRNERNRALERLNKR